MKDDPTSLIKQKILESKRIAITSHLRPDGDSICTSLALYRMGKGLGKDISVFVKDNIPFPFSHFPDAEKIQIRDIPSEGFDLVILLECANVSRSGQNNLDNYFKINIDHHHSNDFYADIDWVDPEAAAVACMIFVLGEEIGVEFTPQIATHLYSAIVSDTGSFQFSNTKAHAFEICYKLVSYGAIPIKVSEMLFNNNPPEKIRLLGQVLATLRMNKQGNIVAITMFKRFLDSLRMKEIDTEDITTLARSIKGSQVVLFFKELKKDTFRVSIRSKGNINAAMIAEFFGGGGHVHAAGFTVQGRYEDLIEEIPATVQSLLKKLKPNTKRVKPASLSVK